MPTYEYACRECEISIVEIRSISDPDPGHICDTCGNRMSKVYSIGAVTFNGSGFYSKDK
jgi:putative FmdB family regulatory protein